MSLKNEIEKMDTLMMKLEQNKNESPYLNLNTIFDSLLNREQELLTLEVPYRSYALSEISNLTDFIFECAKKTITNIRELKEKDNIELPSGEYISKIDVLEAISLFEERIEYQDAIVTKKIEENANILGNILVKRNLSENYISEVIEKYKKQGFLTEDLNKDIIKHVKELLTSRGETDDTINLATDVVGGELEELALELNNLSKPIKYTNANYVAIKLSVRLSKYENTQEDFMRFANDYKIDNNLMNKLMNEEPTKEDMNELWKQFSSHLPEFKLEGQIKPELEERIHVVFDQEFNKKLNAYKESSSKQIKEEPKENNSKEDEVQVAFRKICKNMNFSDKKINELVSSVKNDHGKFKFADGTSMYKELKEQMAIQQKDIYQKINSGKLSEEESKQELLNLISKRQEFFQNIYQYGSMMEKGTNGKEYLSKGHKIKSVLHSEKLNEKLKTSVSVATSLKKHKYIQKLRNRLMRHANYELKVGDVGNIHDVNFSVNVIKITDLANNHDPKIYYITNRAQTIEEFMEINNISGKGIKIECQVTTEAGDDLNLPYDPYHPFVTIEEVKGQVR